MMKARAAVLHGIGQEWSVEEIDVDPPQAGEVLVEWKAAGMCHSDEHLVTGDMVMPDEMRQMMELGPFWPVIGGHEGSGVVAEVGPGVTSVAPGDHVSASFIPACGRSITSSADISGSHWVRGNRRARRGARWANSLAHARAIFDCSGRSTRRARSSHPCCSPGRSLIGVRSVLTRRLGAMTCGRLNMTAPGQF